MGQAVTCVPPRRLGDLRGGMGKGGSCIPRPIQGGLGAAQDFGHPPIQAEVTNFLLWECREHLGKSLVSISMNVFGWLVVCFGFFFFGGIAFALNFSSVLLDSIRKK